MTTGPAPTWTETATFARPWPGVADGYLRLNFSWLLETAVVWIGASVSAGVLGNAAYDALNAARCPPIPANVTGTSCSSREKW